MFHLHNTTNENKKEHKEKWPYIPDHSHRILMIQGSGSGKTNALLNLRKKNKIVKALLIKFICMQKI